MMHLGAFAAPHPDRSVRMRRKPGYHRRVRMIGRKVGAAAVFVLGLLAIGPATEREAQAQPSKTTPEKAAADVRARELFQKGDTAYAEGRYEEANAAFQEAYDLSGRPQFLAPGFR